VQTLTAQRIAPDVRRTLRDREFTLDDGAIAETRTLADDDEVRAVLAGEFGLVFPAGTRFARRTAD
jgi:arylamine N-acetyltransferase